MSIHDVGGILKYDILYESHLQHQGNVTSMLLTPIDTKRICSKNLKPKSDKSLD